MSAGAASITSEIGRLRTVMVHRPDLEIARITPDNKAALLFDDLLWLDRAQEEHDRFVAMMEERDVEVLYFEQLLAETLEFADARAELVAAVFTPEQCGPRVSEQLTAALADEPVDRVVDVLMGGLLERELEQWGIDALFADLVADRFHYVLRPLPNLLFMRDNAAWIHGGLSKNVLAMPARRRESLYIDAIYRRHPRFGGAGFPVLFGAERGDEYPASIEGGDILVLSPTTVMLGIGERTAPAAVEILARRLFAESPVERVIVVHLRRDRSVMHLDTVFTMVDHETFNVYPGLLESVGVHTLQPADGGKVAVHHDHDLVSALKDGLDLDKPRFVETGGDAIGRLREQWDDGNNTLALEPGVVVAYSRNAETNRRLAEAGIEVLELDSSELCRGRGGSRCMTQPLLRDPL